MKRMKLARAGYEPNEVSKSIRVTQDIEQSELTVAILGTEVTGLKEHQDHSGY
jgi:hypothetical protein